MKNALLLLILPALFIGCQTPSSEADQQESSMSSEPTNTVVQTAAVRENKEYIDWHSIRINGKLPLLTTVKNIQDLLGKPDSVIKHHPEACPSFFNTDDSRLSYYDGYHFEQSGDSIIFNNVDFRKNKDAFLQSNGLKLSSATTLEELKKHFPNAVKNIFKTEASYNLYNIGSVDAIMLRPLANTDDTWYLLFQDGKLIMVDNYIPC